MLCAEFIRVECSEWCGSRKRFGRNYIIDVLFRNHLLLINIFGCKKCVLWNLVGPPLSVQTSSQVSGGYFSSSLSPAFSCLLHAYIYLLKVTGTESSLGKMDIINKVHFIKQLSHTILPILPFPLHK